MLKQKRKMLRSVTHAGVTNSPDMKQRKCRAMNRSSVVQVSFRGSIAVTIGMVWRGYDNGVVWIGKESTVHES